MKIAPALTLTVHPSLLIVPAGDANRPREISVEITHNATRDKRRGQTRRAAEVEVEADDRPLAFTRQNERTARSFKVIPPTGASGAFDLKAVAEANSRQYDNGYSVISTRTSSRI